MDKISIRLDNQECVLLNKFIEFMDINLESLSTKEVLSLIFEEDIKKIIEILNLDYSTIDSSIYKKKLLHRDKIISAWVLEELFNIFHVQYIDKKESKDLCLKIMQDYIRDLNLLQKQIYEYLTYNRDNCIHEIQKYIIKVQIEYQIASDKAIIAFGSISDIILFTFNKIYLGEFKINRCENCGKFFMPSKRSSEIYCNRVLTNGRTCKQVGYENKINSDDIMKEYRKAYKTRNAIKNRNKLNSPNAEADFKRWVYKAKEYLEKCKAGEISLAEYKELLKQ